MPPTLEIEGGKYEFVGGQKSGETGWGPVARPDRAQAREAGSRKIAAAIYA